MAITLEKLANKALDEAPLLITIGVGAFIAYKVLEGQGVVKKAKK